MKKLAVIIGMREMGGVFAWGLLPIGTRVYPILRGVNPQETLQKIGTRGFTAADGERSLTLLAIVF
ncbi:MAG TPA: hypothetical protein VIM41_13820 [Gammaproteobacteria bacterium]